MFRDSYLLEETFPHYFYKYLRPRAKKPYFFFDFFPENNQAIKFFAKTRGAKVFLKARDRGWSVVNTCRLRNHMASAKAKIRHVFGDTFSCRAAPPDILVKLSEFYQQGAKECSNSEAFLFLSKAIFLI